MQNIFFDLQVTKDQSSVAEGIQICLPTLANFLEFSGALDRLSRQLLFCKEEAVYNRPRAPYVCLCYFVEMAFTNTKAPL